MTMVGFPLLLIPVAIYNMIALLMPDVALAELAKPLFTVKLVSGIEWPVTLPVILLTLGVLMLMFEVIKGARPGAKFLTDHLLSLIVFAGSAAEFVMLHQFGTSTFFLLTLLTLADFLSGIALRARRGTVVAGTVSRKRGRDVEPPVAESQVVEPELEPVPEHTVEPRPELALEPATVITPVPPATSVAESVLKDRPDPAIEPHVEMPASRLPKAPTFEVPSTKLPSTEVASTEVVAHESPATEIHPVESGHEPHAGQDAPTEPDKPR